MIVKSFCAKLNNNGGILLAITYTFLWNNNHFMVQSTQNDLYHLYVLKVESIGILSFFWKPIQTVNK